MSRRKPRRPAGVPGKVRIAGGHLRGSVLAVPERDGLRPTPARVRETLFNWLSGRVAGARCLDLFAGSGALGIEALSRGAASAQFVERDARLADALKANLARLGQVGDVVTTDAASWLEQTRTDVFDVVFLDPPFALDLWQAVTGQLERAGCLADEAWVHVEMPLGHAFTAPPTWHAFREGKAGQVRYVLYHRQSVS